MSEVTRSIPVTARFDGCFCSEECPLKMSGPTCCLPHKSHAGRWYVNENNIYPVFDTVPMKIDTLRRRYRFVKINKRLKYARVRTRLCCETFGMGEED